MGGGRVPAVTCLERRGTRNPFTVPSAVKLLCFTAIPRSASVRECLQHLRRSAGVSPSFSSYQCARIYFLTRRSPAALREVAWSESDRLKKERFTSIRGISVSNGTHNSEEQNTNTTLYLRLLLLIFLLFLLSSQCWCWRMAQILPIRFQEHLQVKPHKHTNSSVSTRRVASRQTVNTQLCPSGLARALRSCTHKLHTWYICDI